MLRALLIKIYLWIKYPYTTQYYCTTFDNLPSLVLINISSSPSTRTITDDVNSTSASLTTGVDVKLPPLSATTSKVDVTNKLQTCKHILIKHYKWVLHNQHTDLSAHIPDNCISVKVLLLHTVLSIL